ncbi:hypothetical protein ACLMPM_09005 [Yersinia enterocolitica]|uniref:hypothetical protein n=1 Tax=Yersinia enterocolitica TaxID=630 RepID=UPI00398D0BAF
MTNIVQEFMAPQWPQFPDGIPPEGAHSPDGDYFRITNKQTPSAKCCASDYNKDPDILSERTGLQFVCSYGISIQNTIEGARETVGKFRNATRTRFIAKGYLTAEVGLVKQTFKEEYHHTLWTYDGVKTHKYFHFQEAVKL